MNYSNRSFDLHLVDPKFATEDVDNKIKKIALIVKKFTQDIKPKQKELLQSIILQNHKQTLRYTRQLKVLVLEKYGARQLAAICDDIFVKATNSLDLKNSQNNNFNFFSKIYQFISQGISAYQTFKFVQKALNLEIEQIIALLEGKRSELIVEKLYDKNIPFKNNYFRIFQNSKQLFIEEVFRKSGWLQIFILTLVWGLVAAVLIFFSLERSVGFYDALIQCLINLGGSILVMSPFIYITILSLTRETIQVNQHEFNLYATIFHKKRKFHCLNRDILNLKVLELSKIKKGKQYFKYYISFESKIKKFILFDRNYPEEQCILVTKIISDFIDEQLDRKFDRQSH